MIQVIQEGGSACSVNEAVIITERGKAGSSDSQFAIHNKRAWFCRSEQQNCAFGWARYSDTAVYAQRPQVADREGSTFNICQGLTVAAGTICQVAAGSIHLFDIHLICPMQNSHNQSLRQGDGHPQVDRIQIAPHPPLLVQH